MIVLAFIIAILILIAILWPGLAKGIIYFVIGMFFISVLVIIGSIGK